MEPICESDEEHPLRQAKNATGIAKNRYDMIENHIREQPHWVYVDKEDE